MISVIVPVLNEQDNILALLDRIKKSIDPDDEIIVVDDGSTDLINDFLKNHSCRVLRHNKNLGKGKALINGINSAIGDIIIFIDGDGQDDPSEIPKLLSGINRGYDFVIGSRFVEDDSKKITRFTKNSTFKYKLVYKNAMKILNRKIKWKNPYGNGDAALKSYGVIKDFLTKNDAKYY